MTKILASVEKRTRWRIGFKLSHPYKDPSTYNSLNDQPIVEPATAIGMLEPFLEALHLNRSELDVMLAAHSKTSGHALR